MASRPLVFRPDLLLSGGVVHADTALVVRDGVVTAVGEVPQDADEVTLPKWVAILPGLVTAHSHAFQRAIRGRTEYRNHAVDDFWTWREAMYAAAERLSPTQLRAVSLACFQEMALVGITTVGEFHYLHRDANGKAYANPNELDLTVLKAARDVGLRTVLLRVAYARSGFGIADNPRQRRFIEPSADEYLRNLDALAKEVSGDQLVTVGAAPHSVRACPAEWIRDISAEAQRRQWPLHLHVSEQTQDVEQCRAEYGLTPPLLLENLGALTERTTAVHGVHLTDEDIAALGRAQTTVCACPTTERNLGDGIIRADKLLAAGVRLAVGADSECQIDPLEDARALELQLRLLQGKRCVLDSEQGRIDSLGQRLYSIASEGGMRSLGLPGGALRVGEPADFIVVDLDDASMVGTAADNLAASAVFGMERSAIRDVWVAGEQIVQEGHAVRWPEHEARQALRDVMKDLWGGR